MRKTTEAGASITNHRENGSISDSSSVSNVYDYRITRMRLRREGEIETEDVGKRRGWEMMGGGVIHH